MATWSAAGMANVLNAEKKNQVIALGKLGWPLRRIEAETGVRRETAAKYLREAGVGIRPAGAWGRRPPPPNPAKQVSTDFPPPPPRPERSPQASACEPHREFIERSLRLGRNATAIYQDLVTAHAFESGYSSVMRYVQKTRGVTVPEISGRITTPPGEEAQVDYGEGPMVRSPAHGKYVRTRLFVLTLGYSRRCVRLITFKSSSQIWAELHERAFRRLGGAPRVVVLDNLREGVKNPEFFDPILNPVYRDMLKHYGVVGLPCRVGDPDRKGKVESGVNHAQMTPLKGLRFEELELAQAYLDEWEERWADTRIHGTTKRQVSAMFEEERRALSPLPPTQAQMAGPSVGAVCAALVREDDKIGVRRVFGIRPLLKKYGPANVDKACAVALEMGTPTYRFVARYLEHHPPVQLTLRQVDPLIRELTHYRDLIARLTGDEA